MKQVTRVITFDGVEHKNDAEAGRYLDGLYANHLTNLAHTLVQIDKYGRMVEFLDKNLDKFAMLETIKEDMKMESNDE